MRGTKKNRGLDQDPDLTLEKQSGSDLIKFTNNLFFYKKKQYNLGKMIKLFII